jgi:hypothetical protein
MRLFEASEERTSLPGCSVKSTVIPRLDDQVWKYLFPDTAEDRKRTSDEDEIEEMTERGED